ncbi:MAG: enoyl-CoA hydratase-related protein [Pseudomonadota bacterium]
MTHDASLSTHCEGAVTHVVLTRETITDALVRQFHAELDAAEERKSVVITLRGTQDTFCTGADFDSVTPVDPENLYRLWQRLAQGPFVSICLVDGRALAGGIGFVAACDMCMATHRASFAVSELLFGLHPACVLPFLVRKIGDHRARLLTLTTQTVGVEKALEIGLVDAVSENLDLDLGHHIRRIQHLDAGRVGDFKSYAAGMTQFLDLARSEAVAENRRLFSDPQLLANIDRYKRDMKFPWET